MFKETEAISFMIEDGSESLADFLDRAIIEATPSLPPQSCCEKLTVGGVSSVGANPNGTYSLTARVLNGRPLYKQTNGDNFLYFDTDDNYCFGADANQTCHRSDVRARMTDDALCPHELTDWTNGPTPLFNCTDHFPNTVKPEDLDTILRDPLKVFLIRFFDSGKESARTHKTWNSLVEKIDKKQIFNFIIPYQVNCDSNPKTRAYCEREHEITSFPDVVAFKNGKERV